MSRLGARELLDVVIDVGSFLRWDTDPLPPRGALREPEQSYLDELAEARERSGVDESVLSGEATLQGRRVAIIMGEFRFLAGSIGMAAAERLTCAIERATAAGLPLLAVPASGGTRMQEGTVAFMQMVQISAAIAAHKSAGFAYVVYLRHPTTGGVAASWGSLGHVTAAEPVALVGFWVLGSIRRSTGRSSRRACRPRRTSRPTDWSTPWWPPRTCGLSRSPCWRCCAPPGNRRRRCPTCRSSRCRTSRPGSPSSARATRIALGCALC